MELTFEQKRKLIDEIYEEAINDYNLDPNNFIKRHIELSLLEQLVFLHYSISKDIRYAKINQNAKKILPFVDLSELNCLNVDVTYTDFSNNNMPINPQTVFRKNLRGCKFDGRDLGDLDFKDCDVRGSSFVGCTGGKNFDKAKGFDDIVETKDKGNAK